ncbi:MAG: transposase [Planctomycetes bacterium]|nr:transposase [Planctomycetota bacterium]
MTHTPRPRHAARTPVHITLRLAEKLPSLRSRVNHRVVLDGLLASSKPGFRVVHYAALTNHIHLICEASGTSALSRGMQGLCIRLARRLNRSWGRTGTVFDDHYHVHSLRTPTEVRNALRYVLNNARRHGLALQSEVDPCSSARWLDSNAGPFPTPRTWLLRAGWRRLKGSGAGKDRLW